MPIRGTRAARPRGGLARSSRRVSKDPVLPEEESMAKPVEQIQLARFDGEPWALFGEILDASEK
jgi:hypothetical protein